MKRISVLLMAIIGSMVGFEQSLALSEQGDETCHGESANVVGTNGDDTIELVGGDVLVARAGNDTVTGLGEGFVICTGAGNDSVNLNTVDANYADMFGGAGRDRLVGTPYADGTIQGGGGNDHVFGGSGTDTLRGGAGDDLIISGDGGAQNVFGGSGNDVMDGGRHNEREDNMEGGPGDDVLRGREADDDLRGQGGNDSLDGGPGDNLNIGGPGTDHCENPNPQEGADGCES